MISLYWYRWFKRLQGCRTFVRFENDDVSYAIIRGKESDLVIQTLLNKGFIEEPMGELNGR